MGRPGQVEMERLAKKSRIDRLSLFPAAQVFPFAAGVFIRATDRLDRFVRVPFSKAGKTEKNESIDFFEQDYFQGWGLRKLDDARHKIKPV